MNKNQHYLFTPEQLTGEDTSHIIDHPLATMHCSLIEPLVLLQQAAKRSGFELAIASCFRSFKQQQIIWDKKWTGERPVFDSMGITVLDIKTLTVPQKIEAILRWSALPGASRHHWGTDFDVYAKNLQNDEPIKLEPWVYGFGHQENKKIALQAPFYQWLIEHSAKFCFFHPYNKDRGGVAFEPWHISYAPLSQFALELYNLELLKSAIKRHNIAGQADLFNHLDQIYQRYVINIDQNTLK